MDGSFICLDLCRRYASAIPSHVFYSRLRILRSSDLFGMDLLGAQPTVCRMVVAQIVLTVIHTNKT